MGKKIGILQSNYIPWKGYFDLIASVDEFIIIDDLQYTRGDWRNRNLIKTCNGPQWLTIPVLWRGKRYQKINETKIADVQWVNKHIKALKINYSKARFYKDYIGIFINIYRQLEGEKYISNINYPFIKEICKFLGINTEISRSTDYKLVRGKTERIVNLCQQANATEYISGPNAKGYIKEEFFKKANIKLSWMDYSGYKEYFQLYPPFNHFVSIIDLILNTGNDAKDYLKYTK